MEGKGINGFDFLEAIQCPAFITEQKSNLRQSFWAQ